jgi:hypothetical protein
MAKSRTSGQGRPKGVPNKLNRDLREMILGALSDAGGRDYLARCAAENPGPFLALLGKILPTQLTGEGGGAVATVIEVVTNVPRRNDSDEDCDATYDDG